MPDPPFHKFIVFSELDANALVVPALVQCPNCGAVHKVREVGVSDILRKEDAPTILTVDEIKGGLSEKIISGLAGYDLELHQWMEVRWILDNEAWGRTVILSKDTADGLVSGKFIQILSPTVWRFSNFSREELIAEQT